MNYDTGLSRTFVWDEAGIDPTGGIVLIEEEINGIIPLHIEGHIARLRVMAVKGECISKVIWTIRDADFDEMCGLLRFYRGSIDSLPAMEIWSEGGVRLGVA